MQTHPCECFRLSVLLSEQLDAALCIYLCAVFDSQANRFGDGTDTELVRAVSPYLTHPHWPPCTATRGTDHNTVTGHMKLNPHCTLDQ